MKENYDDNYSIPQENCKSKNKEILQYILLTYKCDVCANIPRYPLQKQAKSSNYFCANCIEDSKDILFPSKAELGLLEHLEVSCFNVGCTEIFNYKNLADLNNHAIKCPKKKYYCGVPNMCSSTLIQKIELIMKSNNDLSLLVKDLTIKNDDLQSRITKIENNVKDSYEKTISHLRKEILKLKVNQIDLQRKFLFKALEIKKKIKNKINHVNNRMSDFIFNNAHKTQYNCPNHINNITHNHNNSKYNIETKIFDSTSPNKSPKKIEKEVFVHEFPHENNLSSVEIDTGASFLPILMDHEVFKSLNIKKAVLLYRGSDHDFSAAAFHSKCDNKGPTITIVKSEKGNIFGGYTPIMWDSSNCWGIDNKKESFLFSITRSSKHKLIKPKYAIDNCAVFGPTFGNGADLYISDECHLNESSYTELGDSYESNYKLLSIEARQFLSGSIKYFRVEEYEVYLIY